MPEVDELLVICERAARAGAEQLVAWRNRFQTREKSLHDMVTDADLASQEAVRAVIQREFPDHGFLGEENPDLGELEKPLCWVVDPLDGTTNYVHGFPCYAVSVAVARRGVVIAGCVLDPVSDECFLAGRWQGSTLNGQKIATSQVAEIGGALVAVSFPPETVIESPDIQAFLRITPLCQAVRRTGSAALNLAYVACGRLDSHWAHSIHPWDSAAGVLLVEEAGGVLASSKGKPYRLADGDYFVSATRELHEKMLPLVVG